ncbi:MAG: glycosyltransferase family 1 protein [Dehalococcoidia bacterium]|nr:glycosyltransferase family 1 protein [Dehalococcoidia bacterium]
MKIALVSPYDFAYPGGVVSHISSLGRQLERLGHTVKILAPAATPNSLGLDNLIAIGRPVPIPSGGSIARLSLSVWLEHRVKTILDQERFDVIHLHEPLAPVLPLTVLCFSNAANVGTFHAFHGSGLQYLLSRRLIDRWFQKLDARIAVSEPARRYVSKSFPGEYHIIPNGIDVDLFSEQVPPFDAFNDGKLNILFVGRLEKRKGLKYLLCAFGRLKWQYPNLRLIVAGPGNPGKECYRIMSERALQDVVFVGGVSGDAVRRYYHTAQIFCTPATGKESFGIVLGEAMAAGKPIVASNIEGFRGVMTDGQEGFLVTPKNEEALALALERLILDPALRLKMGQQGKRTVQKYRWDGVAAQIVQCYEEALASHRATPAREEAVGA